jgi:putative nucleotidyltransferase with HDIG domain
MQALIEQLELVRLPALPQVLGRLLHELNSENLQLRTLSELIRQDAALAMKVLAVANSSAYRRQNSVESIEQCVNLLGLNMVKIIAISISLQQFLNNLSGGASFNFGKYWQHFLITAFLSKAIAQAIGYPNPEEAYLTGLLHDIGKFALLAVKTGEYADLLEKHGDDEDFIELEASTFGVTHCEIGAALAERWNLDSLMSDAIRHHHDVATQIGSATELVKLVQLANVMSSMRLETNHPALALARSLFGISVEDAQRLNADAHSNLIALAIPLGVQIQDDSPLGAPRKKVPSSFVNAMPESQRQLGEEMRNATMLAISRDVYDSASDENELLSNILQTASILFEPRQAYLFEWDSQSNLLSGRPVEGQPELLSRIRLPLEPDRSLIANALLWNAMTNSFSKEKTAIQSLIDEQINRMADSEGIFCIPLGNKKFMFGVLVLAYRAGVLQRLDSNLRFLPAFARQAADSISMFRNQLQQAELANDLRVETYKLQARKVVHEANNPLAILKNYLRALDYKLAENHAVAKELEILNEEIDRVANIIHKFANPEDMRGTVSGKVNVNVLINDVVTVCEKAMFLPAKISVNVHLDDALPAVEADPDSLKQVFVNLFKNAAEAMTNGGRLTVTTAMMVTPEKGNCINISIADTGPGIPSEVLSGLFSPVKTTKGAANSGLGLSITSDLLSNLGGSISCKSVPGSGTTFEVTLPCQRGNPDRHASA